MSHRQPVKPGIDLLLTDSPLASGQRIGLVLNQASVTGDLRHGLVELPVSAGHDVSVILAPEHGVWGDRQAQETVADGSEETASGMRVVSLYGPRLAPTRDALDDADLIVFDLQDVGARYYTFIWTMLICMRACKEAGKRMVVLDRPNPINGVTLEGNVLEHGFTSFVGMHPIPVRHGMTIGELALMFNDEAHIGCDLSVVKMQGWRREMFFDETGLSWVLPSPNMPTLDTAVVYPGMCLLEGTNLSEGRGTTRPFELFGAPFVDPRLLSTKLNGERLPGVVFRPACFRPTFDKFSGELCCGAQMHVIDRRAFKPFYTGLAIISTIRELWPEKFAWLQPPYEFETERLPFDILCGTDRIRLGIEAGVPLKQIEAGWRQDQGRFRELREQYLLY